MIRHSALRSLLALTTLISFAGCKPSGPPEAKTADFASAKQRIENDTNMPPVAKQAALQNLERQQNQQNTPH